MRFPAAWLLSIVAVTVLTMAPVRSAAAEEQYEFTLGFKTLAEMIPDGVGEPLENEHHDLDAGDALQQTSKGLLVWRKADNWTAFTDGYTTWINGPYGLQSRANEKRFWWEARSRENGEPAASARASLLEDTLLLAWYGNPLSPYMGVLGKYSGDDLAGRLERQAEAYAPYTQKRIQPAYELIAVVAQSGPGVDGKWRRREMPEVIQSMLDQARAHGFHLILDVQVGQSDVPAELEYLRPWLEQPEVHLALDPEFDMWPGQAPGQQIGQMTASDVNYAIEYLQGIVRERGLPPKVLVVHQFTMDMLPDKGSIGDSPEVDVVLHMDGFGSQAVKLGSYGRVMDQPLEFAGIKLFYDYDPGLFSPEQVMSLDPVPSFVSYQ